MWPLCRFSRKKAGNVGGVRRTVAAGNGKTVLKSGTGFLPDGTRISNGYLRAAHPARTTPYAPPHRGLPGRRGTAAGIILSFAAHSRYVFPLMPFTRSRASGWRQRCRSGGNRRFAQPSRARRRRTAFRVRVPQRALPAKENAFSTALVRFILVGRRFLTGQYCIRRVNTCESFPFIRGLISSFQGELHEPKRS